MNDYLIIPKLIILLGGSIITTAVFGQTTYSWTGAADGTNIANAGNWNPNGIPNGTYQDIAQWDGVTTTNLFLSYGGLGFPGTGFGTLGVNFVLTANQINSVNIINSQPVSSPNLPVFEITNNSATATLNFGDGTENVLNIIMRPAGATHSWVNNSVNPCTIYPNVRWQAGGGTRYLLDFGGTGNWIVTNNLVAEGPISIQKDGSGTVYWNGPSSYWALQNGNIGSPVTIKGGTLVLQNNTILTAGYHGAGLTGTQDFLNNGILQYDAVAQAQILAGVISGTGRLIVSNGTLTLAATNTYTGNTEITNNGTLVVRSVGGDMSLDGGTLVPVGVGSIGTLYVAGNLTISSGTVLVTLNKALWPSNSVVSVTGSITNSGGTLKLLNFGPALLVGDKAVTGGAAMMIVSPGFTLVNNLAEDGSVTVTSVAPPAQITAAVSGGQLNLSWPASFTGLHLQVQTNSLAVGLSTNWFTILGTDGGNSYSTTLNNSIGSVFFRLAP